jgi:hypothetical protein
MLGKNKVRCGGGQEQALADYINEKMDENDRLRYIIGEVWAGTISGKNHGRTEVTLTVRMPRDIEREIVRIGGETARAQCEAEAI